MDSAPPLTICRVVRPLPGGSQSFSVQCDDGFFYVAKFMGNPQGNRTLINEWIGASLLSRLGVTTPRLRLLRLPPNAEGLKPFFRTPDGRLEIVGDLHLGSLYPADPDKVAIYDWLPDKVVENLLVNASDFVTTFIADCWAGHGDKRQAVFHRNKRRGGFEASMIDHGRLFGGHRWKLFSSPVICRYWCPSVYRGVDLNTIARQTIDLIQSWSLSQINEMFHSAPPEWSEDGDQHAFSAMAEQLIRRSETLFTWADEWLSSLRHYISGASIPRIAPTRTAL